MRKQNSSFQTGFISEAGNQLKNYDYFGYVELDEYACYVIADDITESPDEEGAKLAIETVVMNFQASPSMSRHRLKTLLREANKAMMRKGSDRRLKASITVVVTDYQKMRYGYVGNTRLRMYRGGIVYKQTSDMSLSQNMAEQEMIPKDEVMRHEERNNLYAYLGQKRIRPYLSKKIKLIETDIIILYTRGIWENVDEAELDDVFSEASNEVQGSLDSVEELLLSRQPENLDNYTLTAIFVNKVYLDPKKKKRLKMIIIISVTVFLVLLIAGIVIWVLHRRNVQQRADMDYHFTNTVEYINSGNYVRAKEECEEAQKISVKLKDNAMRNRLQEYMFVIETVILADESYSEMDYERAEEYFLSALNQARYADNIGTGYMEARLESISNYQAVEDYLELGNSLLEKGDYDGAEEKYILAKNLAVSIHDAEGRQNAIDALENLYEEKSASEAQQQQEANEKAGDAVAAAEIVASGDKACLEGDFVSAKVYYTMAVLKYSELQDEEGQRMVEEKLETVEQKINEQEEKKYTAVAYETQGTACRDSGDLWGAKSQYLSAKSIYQELGNTEDVQRIENIISELDALLGQT